LFLTIYKRPHSISLGQFCFALLLFIKTSTKQHTNEVKMSAIELKNAGMACLWYKLANRGSEIAALHQFYRFFTTSCDSCMGHTIRLKKKHFTIKRTQRMAFEKSA
jgi:hypothetical protein